MKNKRALIPIIIGAFLFIIYAASKTKKIVNAVFKDQKDYIKKMLPLALAVERATGIPHLFLLAQSAFETGWGKSSLVPEAFNFGGIKAKPGQDYVTKYTWEHVSDPNKYPTRDKSKDKVLPEGKTAIYLPQNFAKFPDLQTGFDQYKNTLLKPRYSGAFQYKNDPYKFAAEIRAAGYATDVNYTAKLAKMIDAVKKYI